MSSSIIYLKNEYIREQFEWSKTYIKNLRQIDESLKLQGIINIDISNLLKNEEKRFDNCKDLIKKIQKSRKENNLKKLEEKNLLQIIQNKKVLDEGYEIYLKKWDLMGEFWCKYINNFT
jgi:UDP-galactopyranose mutase